jgi:two-component system chemotaxis response regulator CheB
MPRAAAETGLVDYIEDAHRIPSILERLVLS